MANNNINNYSNISNNEINNNKNEVKTMKQQINIATINKYTNSNDVSVIASAVNYGFLFNTNTDIEQISAYLLLCELNNFAAPGWSYSSGDGLARLAQVYYNTVPAGMLNVSGIDRCGYVLNPDVYEESYHFDLNGWDIGCYIDDSGEVLPIKALTADDYDQIGEYAKQINSLQPERIRLSDDQIDAYIANAKLEG